MLVNFNRAQNVNFQTALINFGVKMLVNIVISATGKVIDYINNSFEKSIIANIQQSKSLTTNDHFNISVNDDDNLTKTIGDVSSLINNSSDVDPL